MSFKIYTKTGDAGETSLYGGKRVAKDVDRIEAYGTVDELNSHLGLLASYISAEAPAREAEVHALASATLLGVQSDLFTVGSQLATPPPAEGAAAKTPSVIPIAEVQVINLERAIDRLDKGLPALSNFILPVGSPAVSQAHVCRTVARRAERRVVTLAAAEPVDAALIRYLNRLSDYLFVLSRALAHATDQEERPWVPLKH